MKLKNLILSASTLALASSAMADVTVDITGATAFRVATLDSIKARFVASGQPFKFAHDRNLSPTPFNAATLSVWQGTFPGVVGTTTIRTSFNGSVEGIRAIVDSPTHDPAYLNPSVLSSVTAVVGGNNSGNGLANTSSPTATAQSEIAFSDVSIAATPFSGNPVQPSDAAAGVVTFTMIANQSAPAGLTNVTAKQFQALFGNGFLPLSVFTGDEADNGSFVFATGRNDGSGTRTTYLAETGYGITTLVNQFVRTAISGDTITEMQRVPAGGGTAPAIGGTATPSNASTVWGQDIDGNGGYSSGSALRDDMGRTTAAVTVYDADGSELGTLPLTLVTWLSTGDALGALGLGAKLLNYNGVGITPISGSGLSAADKAKVTEGQYTAWSYQQMYRRGDITTGDVVTVYNGIKSNLALGASGISIADMHVGREFDGGPVAP